MIKNNVENTINYTIWKNVILRTIVSLALSDQKMIEDSLRLHCWVELIDETESRAKNNIAEIRKVYDDSTENVTVICCFIEFKQLIHQL